MAITDDDIASFAAEVSSGFAEAQQRAARRGNARDRHVAPGLAAKVAPLLYAAAHEAASAIARQAGSDPTLAERRTSYRDSSGIKGVTASLTLMVATPPSFGSPTTTMANSPRCRVTPRARSRRKASSSPPV